MGDFKSKVKQLRAEGMSLSAIAHTLAPDFPDRTEKQVWEKVRGVLREKKPKTNNRVVGVFGDVHAPFDNPQYLRFLQDTFKRYGVTDVVCVGDLVDFHAISRFQSEGCAKGAYDEFDAAYTRVQEYISAFPKLKFCLGNHDLIPERQAATLGIGKRFVKDLRQLFDLPKGWDIADEHLIGNVLYKHGINCCGKDGALNTAIQERMSVVIGHSHAFGGCKYSANKRGMIFGLNTGCGIDVEQYAFRYGKHDKNRPTLGCGIVFGDEHAMFVPMVGEEYA